MVFIFFLPFFGFSEKKYVALLPRGDFFVLVNFPLELPNTSTDTSLDVFFLPYKISGLLNTPIISLTLVLPRKSALGLSFSLNGL